MLDSNKSSTLAPTAARLIPDKQLAPMIGVSVAYLGLLSQSLCTGVPTTAVAVSF